MKGSLQLGRKSESGNPTAVANSRNRVAGALAKMAMSQSAPQVHTIEIRSKGKGYQAPVSTCVRRLDRVLFGNKTGGEVSIQFAKSTIFGEPGLELRKGQEVSLEVAPDAPEGFHGFAVYCHPGGSVAKSKTAKAASARGSFATGGSMPIIIVDPKK